MKLKFKNGGIVKFQKPWQTVPIIGKALTSSIAKGAVGKTSALEKEAMKQAFKDMRTADIKNTFPGIPRKNVISSQEYRLKMHKDMIAENQAEIQKRLRWINEGGFSKRAIGNMQFQIDKFNIENAKYSKAAEEITQELNQLYR